MEGEPESDERLSKGHDVQPDRPLNREKRGGSRIEEDSESDVNSSTRTCPTPLNVRKEQYDRKVDTANVYCKSLLRCF